MKLVDDRRIGRIKKVSKSTNSPYYVYIIPEKLTMNKNQPSKVTTKPEEDIANPEPQNLNQTEISNNNVHQEKTSTKVTDKDKNEVGDKDKDKYTGKTKDKNENKDKDKDDDNDKDKDDNSGNKNNNQVQPVEEVRLLRYPFC